MERQLKIIAYLLARNMALDTGESIRDILEEAMAMTEDTQAAGEEAVENIYKRYPSKCPIRGTSTGKCAKNKAQIRNLLKKSTESDIIYTIDRYVRECTEGGVYIKNFSTFLNNLPDYGTMDEPTESPQKKMLDYDSFVAKMRGEQ